MTEQQTPSPEPAAAQPAGAPSPEQTPTPVKAGEAKFTDSDMAKMRRQNEKLAGQLEKLQEERKAFEESQKTEAQKAQEAAIEAARQEVAQKYEAQISQQAIDARIREELIKAGQPSDLVHVVTAKAEIETVDDVPAVVAEVIEGLALPKATMPGQRGAPNARGAEPYPRGGRWDRAQVAEVRRDGKYSQYREQILEAQTRGDFG